jgi:hypothetical protein
MYYSRDLNLLLFSFFFHFLLSPPAHRLVDEYFYELRIIHPRYSGRAGNLYTGDGTPQCTHNTHTYIHVRL